MRIRFCPFDEITVRGTEGLGERFGRGAAVDFDRVVGRRPDGSALTLEDALGDYAAAFRASPFSHVSDFVPPSDDGDEQGEE